MHSIKHPYISLSSSMPLVTVSLIGNCCGSYYFMFLWSCICPKFIDTLFSRCCPMLGGAVSPFWEKNYFWLVRNNSYCDKISEVSRGIVVQLYDSLSSRCHLEG